MKLEGTQREKEIVRLALKRFMMDFVRFDAKSEVITTDLITKMILDLGPEWGSERVERTN